MHPSHICKLPFGSSAGWSEMELIKLLGSLLRQQVPPAPFPLLFIVQSQNGLSVAMRMMHRRNTDGFFFVLISQMEILQAANVEYASS